MVRAGGGVEGWGVVKCVEPGFGLGTPQPQPAFRLEGRLALPAWLHLPSELGSAPSPQGSGPFPAEAPGLQWACLLPARLPGCGINYPSDADVTFNGSCSIMLIHPIILL